MRTLLVMALLAGASHSYAAEHTTPEVRAGIKKGVVFGVLPDAEGKLASCKYSMTQDGPANKPDPNFHPSEAFVADTCHKLAQRKWPVNRDKSGNVSPLYDYCMWSEVVPDNAICRVVPAGG